MDYIVTSRFICKKAEIISASIDDAENTIRILLYSSNPITVKYSDTTSAEDDFEKIKKAFANE